MLETRGSHAYYYRSKRSGRAVQRIYIGAGTKARAALAQDARRRDKQQAELAEWSALRSRLDEADALADELHRLTSAALSYFLITGGCYQHARGSGADAAVMDDIRGRLGEYAEMDDYEKEAALPELRRYLALSPDVCAIFGDVALRAKEALAKLAGDKNPMLTESSMLRVAALEAELAPAGSSPEVRLAAQNVAFCWLAAYEAEITASKTVKRKKLQKQTDHCDRRRDRAHRRYQAALRTLAAVRKLLRPLPTPIEIATRLDQSGHRSGKSNPQGNFLGR